jgi:hypothetical protein
MGNNDGRMMMGAPLPSVSVGQTTVIQLVQGQNQNMVRHGRRGRTDFWYVFGNFRHVLEIWGKF